jgi:hypothetical protein
MMDTELITEIYAPQGKLLTSPSEELKPALANYLQVVEGAGKEIAAELKLSAASKSLLEQGFSG